MEAVVIRMDDGWYELRLLDAEEVERLEARMQAEEDQLDLFEEVRA